MKYNKYKFVPVLLIVAGMGYGQGLTATPSYEPVTAEQRWQWFSKSSYGVSDLAVSAVVAGYSTWRNSPEVYGPHWEGFGERYGLAVTDGLISHGAEASLGAIWGEDPRYLRVPEKHVSGRLANVIKMTFVARDRSGDEIPAYARLIAIPGTAVLSNQWRSAGDNQAQDAVDRTILRFGSRMLSNAFSEFWPDVRGHLFHHKTDPQSAHLISTGSR